MEELADIFATNGALAEHLQGFSYREAQQQMAELVAEALATGQIGRAHV